MGTSFRLNDAVFAFVASRIGDRVDLIRDPHNLSDKNAIEVWILNRHVGFIDRNRAKIAAKTLPSEMPICARLVDRWMGEEGNVSLTIQPLMPDIKLRNANGWRVRKPGLPIYRRQES